MSAPIMERTVGGKIRRAAIISLDSPCRQRRKLESIERAGLGEFGAFPGTAEDFKEACSVEVDLLVISAHGWHSHDKVGFGRQEWLNIDELQGSADTLLVLTCFGGDGEHPAVWKKQFSASHVIAASGEPENISGYNAALRVLRDTSIWTAPDEICSRYRENMRAPVLANAGWFVS
ncbi:hypothetical protein [Leucobacter chromiireducens]|uniref:hypothetical protein n=1 Tax=Leucobacter chromiireducens TaxID=283877 RepID=UPI003F8129E8